MYNTKQTRMAMVTVNTYVAERADTHPDGYWSEFGENFGSQHYGGQRPEGHKNDIIQGQIVFTSKSQRLIEQQPIVASNPATFPLTFPDPSVAGNEDAYRAAKMKWWENHNVIGAAQNTLTWDTKFGQLSDRQLAVDISGHRSILNTSDDTMPSHTWVAVKLPDWEKLSRMDTPALETIPVTPKTIGKFQHEIDFSNVFETDAFMDLQRVGLTYLARVFLPLLYIDDLGDEDIQKVYGEGAKRADLLRLKADMLNTIKNNPENLDFTPLARLNIDVDELPDAHKNRANIVANQLAELLTAKCKTDKKFQEEFLSKQLPVDAINMYTMMSRVIGKSTSEAPKGHYFTCMMSPTVSTMISQVIF